MVWDVGSFRSGTSLVLAKTSNLIGTRSCGDWQQSTETWAIIMVDVAQFPLLPVNNESLSPSKRISKTINLLEESAEQIIKLQV
jgi:hypothetical protein